MLTDGVEELHADTDQAPSVAAERRVAAGPIKPAKDESPSGSIDRATAPFFVRIHSKIQVPRSPADVDSEAADSRRPDLELATGQDVWMDADFRGDLRAAELDSVEAVMASSQGRCLRVLADRENWRLELAGPNGGFTRRVSQETSRADLVFATSSPV